LIPVETAAMRGRIAPKHCAKHRDRFSVSGKRRHSVLFPAPLWHLVVVDEDQ
jgi:hypothetical protein